MVSQTVSCPYCGSMGHLEPLYREVARIRELAESAQHLAIGQAQHPAGLAQNADEDKRRLAELTREVAELRTTVARLRGSTFADVT